ncbi:thioesterase II family protein [Umezawaea tangerina]|uniref:Surfactin synthase thioesterase subunit n=1 Tax=Umezawaea tangerina TaxID=84725 RepID=A0A2T0T1Z1_9PSEU|nr:alpha/beta fold hydrolase [Umezawaea tangerina]PRY39664.1 surfactin synthase thioesterase subunit [Umezawaea tangerina]
MTGPFLGKGRPGASTRLFLLPHAGGSAAVFRDWLDAGAGLEVRAVRYPGRAERLADPPPESVQELADDVAVAITSLPRLPYVLLGHSMGALVAFETARALVRRGHPGPESLVVAGCAAPRSPRPPFPDHLPDDDLVSLLRKEGADVRALADPEMRELVLPAVRADLAATARYRMAPGPPLDCPITVLSGVDDRGLDPARLRDWRAHTTARCDLRQLAGGHHFLHEHRDALLGELRPRPTTPV